MLDMLGEMNRREAERCGDSQVLARVAQYEMAYRMQASVPELTDFSKERESTLALYGPDVKKPGTYAYNCLMARRMAERGVRFIQLYHRGWDHHGSVVKDLPLQCQDVDQAQAGLLQDLRQRGLLDDTLVVWGGEFGRTVYCQGNLTPTQYGRDHHPRCFSMWLAGGGIQPGMTYGSTDDFSYNVLTNPVTVHDLHATMLHCMGIDHERLTYKSQGLEQKLTGVEPAKVLKEILS
jgi:arylsulfatase A-like enzyme